MTRFEWETRATRRIDIARHRREFWEQKRQLSYGEPVPGILEQTIERYRIVARQMGQ